MFMEAMMASSLVVASRGCGFAGTSLQNYLPAVWAHVSLSKQLERFHLRLPQQTRFADFLTRFIVPVLAPPNQVWPQEWVRSFQTCFSNAKFGGLRRTRNESMIDIDTSFNLTGEAKDHKKPIDTSKLKSMLQRIPHDSKVHIIFVRKLQTKYFQKEAYELHDIACCRIDRVNPSCNELILSDIIGIPGSGEFETNGNLSNLKLVILFAV
jgi:hypothetical protein